MPMKKRGKGTMKKPKREVYRFKAPELKVIDGGVNYEPSTTPYVQCINGVSTGDTVTTREGSRIDMRGINILGNIKAKTGTGVSQFIRMLVVYDKLVNGVAATMAAVLDVTSASYLTAPKNDYNKDRFIIMFDRLIKVMKSGETGDIYTLRKYIPCRKTVKFNGTNANDESGIVSGAVYVMYVGSESTGTTTSVVDMFSRVTFVDY